MSIKEYAAMVLDKAEQAYDRGDTEEALRLLDLLIETIRTKRNELAKAT